MEIEALLCDAARVREGLLHVLGGGVTRLGRDRFPTALGLDLGMMITLHPTETVDIHRLRIVIQGADGQQIARLDAEFGVGTQPGVQPGELVPVALAVPLQGVPLPGPGSYSLELLLDGQHRKSLQFLAFLQEAEPQPPPAPFELDQD